MGLTREERLRIYNEARAIQEEFNRLRSAGPEAEEQRAALVKRYEELDRLLRAARSVTASPPPPKEAGPPPKEAGPPPSPDVKERVPCPFCAEEILPKAKKCRYCGEWLPDQWWKGDVPVGERRKPQPEPEESARCIRCHEAVPADATLCPCCGNPLGAEAEGLEPSAVSAVEPAATDTEHTVGAMAGRPEPSDVAAAETVISDTAQTVGAPAGLPAFLAATGVLATSILVVYLGYVNGGTRGATLTAGATLFWIALVSLVLKFVRSVGKPAVDTDEE